MRFKGYRQVIVIVISLCTYKLNVLAETTQVTLNNQCIGEDCTEVLTEELKWKSFDKKDESGELDVNKEMTLQPKLELEVNTLSESLVDTKVDQENILSSESSEAYKDSGNLKTIPETKDYIQSEILDLNSTDVNSENVEQKTDKVDVGEDDDDDDDDDEQELEQTSQRRRYFPLLYTFRTLINSFLSDFVEDSGNQDVSFNGSETNNESMIVTNDLLKDFNATMNATDINKKIRFQCAVKNFTADTQGKVKIVNSTELLEILNLSKNQKMSTCVLVMFYAPWCHFCARTAPHYNALARAFPQLDVLAVDTSHFSYLNARFGTVAVPNIMLFHSRSAVRFNSTARVLDNLSQFVTNNTGLIPNKRVKLEPTDFVGPLSCVVVRARDWLLWLAWTFVILCSIYSFVRSQYGQSCINRLSILWQEHQHIE